jgi:small conductance mechanosensitive channel
MKTLVTFLIQTALLSEEEIASKADSTRAALQQFGELVTKDPNTALRTLGQSAIQFGLKVLAALAIYIVGAWIIKRIKKGLRKVFERRKTDRAMASFISSFVSIALTVILIIVAIGALGVNTSSLAALLAAGGMAIGMALSGTVQNFAGGIMLLVFKPFKSGDMIEAQGHIGKVSEINIISTKIVTPDNRTVILPNGALSNGNINNITSLPLRRVETTVTVSYGSDAAAVREAILDILKADPRILDATTPGAADPMVALRAMKESSVEFIVRGWARSEDYWDVLFSMNESIYTGLPERGIAFPFPQLDVHLKQ